MEPIVALLMSLATVGTAWSSYQSASSTRTATFLMGQVNTIERQAALLEVQGTQALALHAAMFMQILDAHLSGNRKLADFYIQRLAPDVRKAYDAWLAQKPFDNPAADPHPFVPSLYQMRGAAEAAALRAGTEPRLAAARSAGNLSGQYLANTVLFAAMLFFAAMSGKFEQPRVRLATFVVAVVLFLIAAGRTLFLAL